MVCLRLGKGNLSLYLDSGVVTKALRRGFGICVVVCIDNVSFYLLFFFCFPALGIMLENYRTTEFLVQFNVFFMQSYLQI